MAAQSTTLSSAGNSVPIILNPVAKTTTLQYTLSTGIASSISANAAIQFTLDDPGTTPAPTISWANLSSAITSSAVDSSVGIIYTVLSPLGGVRLTASSTVTGTITLKSLQSVTG